jgi:hypothetical protein
MGIRGRSWPLSKTQKRALGCEAIGNLVTPGGPVSCWGRGVGVSVGLYPNEAEHFLSYRTKKDDEETMKVGPLGGLCY